MIHTHGIKSVFFLPREHMSTTGTFLMAIIWLSKKGIWCLSTLHVLVPVTVPVIVLVIVALRHLIYKVGTTNSISDGWVRNKETDHLAEDVPCKIPACDSWHKPLVWQGKLYILFFRRIFYTYVENTFFRREKIHPTKIKSCRKMVWNYCLKSSPRTPSCSYLAELISLGWGGGGGGNPSYPLWPCSCLALHSSTCGTCRAHQRQQNACHKPQRAFFCSIRGK